MKPLESSVVCQIVGIKLVYLNKIVERRLYSVEPSLRSGEGRGSRRWFAAQDVFGIALVWWLFEAGLRTEVIKRVLREISESPKKADANRAAKALQKSVAEYLVIRREIRSSASKDDWPPQIVRQCDIRELCDWLRDSGKKSLHVLPVGSLLADLASQLSKYEGVGEKGG